MTRTSQFSTFDDFNIHRTMHCYANIIYTPNRSKTRHENIQITCKTNYFLIIDYCNMHKNYFSNTHARVMIYCKKWNNVAMCHLASH